MTVKAELPVATQHDRTPPSWGEPSLPVKGPLNDILAQRMVKEAQGKMEKSMSKTKKIKKYFRTRTGYPPCR